MNPSKLLAIFATLTFAKNIPEITQNYIASWSMQENWATLCFLYCFKLYRECEIQSLNLCQYFRTELRAPCQFSGSSNSSFSSCRDTRNDQRQKVASVCEADAHGWWHVMFTHARTVHPIVAAGSTRSDFHTPLHPATLFYRGYTRCCTHSVNALDVLLLASRNILRQFTSLFSCCEKKQFPSTSLFSSF